MTQNSQNAIKLMILNLQIAQSKARMDNNAAAIYNIKARIAELALEQLVASDLFADKVQFATSSKGSLRATHYCNEQTEDNSEAGARLRNQSLLN